MEAVDLTTIRDTLRPKSMYCCNSGKLYWASLLTGAPSFHQMPGYQFKNGLLSELPGGLLLITGGINAYATTVREVVMIDTPREFAVSYQHAH
jgi:hypothetical protein